MDETNRLQSVRRVLLDMLEQYGLEDVLRADPPGGRNPPVIIEFELTAAISTSDASAAANIIVDGSVVGTVTVWNAKKSDASLIWSGASGAWGVAYLRSDGKYVIIQLEC